MVKIDTTAIEGYDEMTAEEKVAVLEAYELEDNSADVERYKNAVSKANSEAADWKKKYNALLSEEEQAKIAKDEEMNSIVEELETLRKAKEVSDHKARFIALGYEEALAEETAQAMVEGDNAVVFANQKKFLESYDKALKAEILKDTSRPPAGSGSDPMTLEAFQKLDPMARLEFSQNNPEEYKQLYGGKE